ncbi:hypothetical protein CCR75_005535 [Bremia lactucae]|uniref:Endonuclease/exonuclease/phosphatase domain-containing protein n=1 Tax=Bremia lactucae TaxID=4779 RepID=A0A976IG90_BRELC|nr:hypothetical protein CCR75_005535 [Bremia lactucae]
MSKRGPFFSSNTAPRNPYYRHSQSQRPRASTTEWLYRFLGALVVVMLFLGTYESFRGVEPLLVAPTYIDPQAKDAIISTEKRNHLKLRSATAGQDSQPSQKLSSSPLRLKIMTFNLRFAGTSDGHNGWQYRKDHVADLIDRYHPVLMGTQEGLKAQLLELEGLLKMPYERFGVEREKNGEFEQIFYDPTVLERLDDGNFWLSEKPDTSGIKGWDANCVRMVTWGKFRIHATQQELFFFNTQLDHVGRTARAEGSRLLSQRIQLIAGNAPVFLVGDFNTYRYASTYKYFTSQEDGPHFYEAWPAAEKQIGNVSYTYHGWAGVKNDGEKTAVRAANHIDWIFFRPQMTVLQTEVITENRNGRYPSDHYPIQAEILFPSAVDLPPPTG